MKTSSSAGKDDKVNGDNRSLALYVLLIFFSLPMALFVQLLAFNKYPLFAPEVIIIYIVQLAISLFVAGIVWRWRFAAFLFVIPLLIIYLNTIIPIEGLSRFIISILPQAPPSVAWLIRKTVFFSFMVLVPFMLLFFLFSKRKSVWRWFSAGSFIMLLATAILWVGSKPFPHIRDINEGTAIPGKNLPLFLYIIWDEHMSIKWTPDDVPQAVTAKKEILDFYDKYNFLLFTNAFTHYYDSDKSIVNALNLNAKPDLEGLKVSKGRRDLTQNEVFNILKKKGYDIRVYQSEYMNFCDTRNIHVNFCYEYGVNSIGDIRNLDIGVRQKALLILGHWLRVVKFCPQAIDLARGILSPILGSKIAQIPILGAPYNSVGPINVMPALERIKSDTFRYRRGYAFFAHLLIPHYPYIYDENNNLKKDPRTWLGLSSWHKTKKYPTRDEQYEQYYAQLRGLYRWLDAWFAELDKNGMLKDAVVIFHGDHGSRICYKEPYVSALYDPGWDRIVKDCYSTLFAVKNVELGKGQVEVPKSLDSLLYEYFNEQQELRVPHSEDNFIYIKPDYNTLRKLPYDRW